MNDPLRMTAQRRIMKEELRELGTHATPSGICEIAGKRLSGINLGTIYRNLETISEIGMIQKLRTAGTQKRFDESMKNHYDVRCIRCGRVDKLLVDLGLMIDEALGAISDYEILGHRIEFYGLCPQCRKEREPAREGEAPRIGIPDGPMSNVG